MENREIESPLAEKKPETSSSWLWKNLKPFGCVLCLVCMAAMLFLCFNSGADPIPGYEPPQSREFYLENPEELAAEINANVAPALEYLLECYAEGDKVVVVIDNDHFAVTRSAVLRYFDGGNIEFSTEN